MCVYIYIYIYIPATYAICELYFRYYTIYFRCCVLPLRCLRESASTLQARHRAPNLPTKIIPATIAWLNISGKFPMDIRIPHLKSISYFRQTLKSRISVRRLAVCLSGPCPSFIPKLLRRRRVTDEGCITEWGKPQVGQCQPNARELSTAGARTDFAPSTKPLNPSITLYNYIYIYIYIYI